jgi:hypothetical protein
MTFDRWINHYYRLPRNPCHGYRDSATPNALNPHSHAAMRDVGSPCSRHAGSGMETRTSETQDKAAWTVAESVREADIDHGAWSSHRGNPRAYPPARRSERDGIPRAPHRPARFGRSALGPVHAACQRRRPAPSCGSPVCRMCGDHTGPRPEQHHRQPKRAGRPETPWIEGVIRPLPGAYPGGETFMRARIPRGRAAWSQSI